MNELNEIKKIIKNFIFESTQIKQQIAEIENKRTQLAKERNSKKLTNTNDVYLSEINLLGKQIAELGKDSQGLQNKLDFKFNEVKKIVNLTIDNFITDGIRTIRKIDEEKQELENKISTQKERNTKYEVQCKEFYERFGRMPESSQNSQKEDKIQDKQSILYKTKIEEIEETIDTIEKKIVELASVKRNFKNGNWTSIVNEQCINECTNTVKQVEEEAIVLPLIEEFQVEEQETVEYVKVEEFEPIKEVEIGEIEVETFNKTETTTEQVDEIELLARTIVEEIITEQTKDLNIGRTYENLNTSKKETITFEDCTKKENTENHSTEKKSTLLSIIAKVENGEIVYKAQVSNGDEIKVYPTLEVKNIILNDNEYREEIKELITSYAVTQYKTIDYKVIKKIDPTVCEVLERFAKKYNYDEKSLIYNYAMLFSKYKKDEIDMMIPITYNFSYLKDTNLSIKEKSILSKICKYAQKRVGIDIIGYTTGISKIKYTLNKIFNLNKIKALSEGKY